MDTLPIRIEQTMPRFTLPIFSIVIISLIPASVSDETLRDFSPVFYLEQVAAVQRKPSSPSGPGQLPTKSDAKNQIFPPMFIARAGLDNTDLNGGLDRFVQLALKNNVLT